MKALLLSAALVLFVTLPPGPALAQQRLSTQQILDETQVMSQAADELILVWWMPLQFWQASFAEDPSITEAQANEIIDILRPYIFLGVVAGKIGPLGGVTYQSEEALRAGVTIKDVGDRSYSPLEDSEISVDVKNFVQAMKPFMANLMGQFGENLNFLVFQSDGEDGPIADPTSEGLFRIAVVDKEFSFRLPLGSILPPRYDPDTGEEFPGNYIFSPFTGTRLVTEP